MHFRSLRIVPVFVIYWIAALPGVPICQAAPLEEFTGCELVEKDWADGDSFEVRMPDGKKKVFRLYYVDCIETSVSTTSDKRRLREQSRYFGIEDYKLTHSFGIKAKEFTKDQLSEPFTLYTSFADARGRSGKPRYYAFVTTKSGKDLASLLVSNGLARSFGLGRETPAGTSRDEWSYYLSDVELAAAIKRNGAWEHSNADAMIAMRKAEREELLGLESIDDALSLKPPSSPIDVNTASLEEIVSTGLRESLADEVVKMRPFDKVDDLLKVKGIGPVTLEKIRKYFKVNPEPLSRARYTENK